MKRKLLLSLAIAVVAVIGFSATAETPVSADGGPHGGYQSATGGAGGTLTDRCAACHRVHQGKSEGKLLKAESPYALCLTCHNGVGSQLDVLDGVKLTALQTVTGLTSRAVASRMFVSTAPYAETWAPPGGVARFTIRVRNSSAVSITPTLGCVNSGLTACAVTNSGAIAAGATGYGYVDVTSDVATTTTTSTITVTDAGGTNATLVLKTTAQNAIAGATLNGGGFRFVNGSAATSRHRANPADNATKPWGYGGSGVSTYLTASATATNNTAGDVNAFSGGAVLECTSCHNPHGTTNYRILKTVINGVNPRVRAWYPNGAGGAFVADEGARGLEGAAPANKYTVEYYGSTGGADANNTGLTTATYGVATLCGACHTAYPSESASYSLTAPTAAAGPNQVHYRHRTEMPFSNWVSIATASYGFTPLNPETAAIPAWMSGTWPSLRLASNATQDQQIITCLTCHRAHGTATAMSGYAVRSSLGGTADDDLSPAQVNTSDRSSVLLFTDNRGMCERCHQW